MTEEAVPTDQPYTTVYEYRDGETVDIPPEYQHLTYWTAEDVLDWVEDVHLASHVILTIDELNRCRYGSYRKSSGKHPLPSRRIFYESVARTDFDDEGNEFLVNPRILPDQQLATLLTEPLGYTAICGVYGPGLVGKRHVFRPIARSGQAWIAGQVIALDVDGEPGDDKLAEVLGLCEETGLHPSFIYDSGSCSCDRTGNHDRLRVVFALDRVITDGELMGRLIGTVGGIFGADPGALDIARVINGGRSVLHEDYGRRVTPEQILELAPDDDHGRGGGEAPNAESHRADGAGSRRQSRLTHQQIAGHTIRHLNGNRFPPRQVIATSGGKFMRFDEERGIWREFDEREMVELRNAVGEVLGDNVGGAVAYGNVSSVINFMGNIPGHFRPSDEFDADADVTAFENGLLNIASGEFREGLRSDDWLTSTVGYEYDPDARIGEFKRFLQEVLVREDGEGGLEFDPQLACLVQEMMGYCLCPHLKANKVFFLQGDGANGKSVLLSVITAMVGRSQVAEAFDVRKLDDETNNALLVNKRVAIQTELDTDGLIPDGRLKTIASGEAIIGKHLYKDKFEFTPHATLLMAGNSLPATRDRSHGFWRRTIVIPFNARFVEATRAGEGDNVADPYLEERLLRELPAILNFAHSGLQRLAGNGWVFTRSESSDAATNEMRDDSDNVLAWARQCIVEGDGGEYAANELYRTYRGHCQSNGYNPLSSMRFYKRIKRIVEDDELDVDIRHEKRTDANYYVGEFRVVQGDLHDGGYGGWVR